MPSWNDGETSSEGGLSAMSSGLDGGYTPDKIEDISFEGLAIDSTELCRVHKQIPGRFVAFEGTNTGRRFLACAEENAVENCGFVCWIDPEWPEPLENALCRLWSKVEESNAARISEKIDHALLLMNMSDEKVKAEKKYNSLIAKVNTLLDDTAANIRKQNYQKLTKGDDELLGEMVKERDSLKLELEKVVQENTNLMQELVEEKKNKEVMKEEKKKLEYMLYDILKANSVNKEKLKSIKLICEE